MINGCIICGTPRIYLIDGLCSRCGLHKQYPDDTSEQIDQKLAVIDSLEVNPNHHNQVRALWEALAARLGENHFITAQYCAQKKSVQEHFDVSDDCESI